jgi:hypothetical protein
MKFITKTKYKKIKHFLIGDWKREYYHSKLERSTPLIYAVSASAYKEKALSGQDTVNNIRTSIAFIRSEIVAKYLLKRIENGRKV